MADTVIKVLLVDDDEDDAVLTRSLLRGIEGQTFQVDWVSHYDEGVARMCGSGGDDAYDVCLVDYRLGAKDGVQFIREAVERACGAPVILLTGQGDHAVDLAAMAAGAADYLNKGQLTASMLERSIRYAIQHKRSEQHRMHLLREQAARAQAEAENRAKDQFLAALSHELRTPLSPVLLAVASMQQDPDLPQHLQEDVSIIRSNIELEARLIDDLLDLTRITRGKVEPRFEVVDAHALLEESIRTCRTTEAVRKGQRLEFEPHAAEHHVWADSARLRQVFWNLLRNAVKFTPEGGRITVRTANTAQSGAGLAPGAGHSAAGQLIVEVEDTGIGIEPDALSRIFNAFEQGDHGITRQFGGLGLGLAISKALVDLHGGTLAAHSAGPGQGATFTLRLATSPSPASETPAPSGPGDGAVAASRRTLSILLVEDHEPTARVLTRLLRGLRHEVQAASTVSSAKQLAESRRFDLIVSDIGLPDGTGLDLMRDLRRRYDLKGIAVSGYGTEEDKRRSRAVGFAEHLTKPVDFRQLQEAIGRVTGE